MTTKTKRKTRGSNLKAELPPSLGAGVCKFIETYLVHAEGDWLGQPFRIAPFWRRIIWRMYELQPDGSRRYDRVLLGFGKGNAKTEMGAALGVAELGGPVVFDHWNGKGQAVGGRRQSPDIPVAAASYEQADLLFGAARTMIREGPLLDHFDTYETEIRPKQGAGRLYRVPAIAGTNDGKRPTFFLADELHEWEGKKARVHLVLSNGRAKRKDAWELSISTAGYDPDSVLFRLYEYGKQVNEGLIDDPRFLFIWHEAAEELDIENPKQLDRAIRAANPAVEHFLDIDNIRQRKKEIAEHEFRRYHLNQWVNAPDTWDVADIWDDLKAVKEVTGPVALGFDGAYSRDSIALVGCTKNDPHLFVVNCWERPEGISDWHVDAEEVSDAILAAFDHYQVDILGYDEMFGRIWSVVMENLESKGCNIVEWPTRSAERFRDGCAKFRSAVLDRRIAHDGDERLRLHVKNARYASDGIRIVKEHKDSTRHIDLAVAGIIAYDLATADTKQWALV